MKYEIDVKFAVGDVVWHKNLATNEAIQTKIQSFRAMIMSDGSKAVVYYTEDDTLTMNIEGDPTCSDVFATKEECDSYPPYVPKEIF